MLIYKITNKINGKVYIGKTTTSLSKRWKWHRNAANQGGQFHFARAIRKYGPKAFTREVIYHAKDVDELAKMETHFILSHQSHEPEKGYNMTLGGEGASLVTEETRRRMSEVRLGKKLSEEHCRHIGDSKRGSNSPHWGKPRSEETRRKIGEAQRGKKLSAEHREKIRYAHQGKVLSEEHRHKLSEAHKGLEFSEIHCQNLSKALSGESNPSYGKRWIHRETETMMVPTSLLNAYIEQGWQLGRVS